MRRMWGTLFFLCCLALVVSGCSGQTEVEQKDSWESKTFLLNLPANLKDKTSVLTVRIPWGSFTYSASEERTAKVSVKAPEGSAALTGATIDWTEEEGVLTPTLNLPVESDLSLADLEVEMDLSYPAAESPTTLNLRLDTGHAVLKGYQGALNLEIADGTILLENIGLIGDSKIQAGGWVQADLSVLAPGVHEISAGFGFLEVRLPLEAGVKVNARTDMGAITNHLDFSYLEPISNSGVGAELNGWLNAGGSELRLYCQNGDISIYPR